MSTSYTTHCDGPDCDSHTLPIANQRPRGWVWAQDDGRFDMAFCSWDCLLKFAGRISPLEAVEL